MNKAFFDLSRAENRDRYKLLAELVVPRAIGWIGTMRRNDLSRPPVMCST